MLIPFKLLTWIVLLKYGQEGTSRRPWISGFIMAMLATFFDVVAQFPGWKETACLLVAYLIVCWLLLHLYYRADGIVASLLLVAVGSLLIFIGVPYGVAKLFDPEL